MAQKVTTKHIIDDETLDKLIGNAKTTDDLFNKDGLLKQLTTRLVERMLEEEMTHHLGYEKNSLEGIIPAIRAMVKPITTTTNIQSV